MFFFLFAFPGSKLFVKIGVREQKKKKNKKKEKQKEKGKVKIRKIKYLEINIKSHMLTQ